MAQLLPLPRRWPVPPASLLLWAGITVLFLYERTYLIQKAGLPHFVVCAGVRVGLLLGLCYLHTQVLTVRLLARRRYVRYGVFTALALAVYLGLQAGYDHYLFGFVIGDQERAGWWHNLPYNLLATAWYLLLTYLVARKLSGDPVAAPVGPPPSAPAADVVDEVLTIKTGGEWVRLAVADIEYAQGLKDYTTLHTRQGKLMVKGSIGTVAGWLPVGRFLRVHKSYLVARQHIQSVSATQVSLAGHTIPLGRAYAAIVLAEFKSQPVTRD